MRQSGAYFFNTLILRMQNMCTDVTEHFKVFAEEQGADLTGIAPVGRFEDLPPEKNPLSIFPETETLIVIGKRITRGTLRGVEEGTQFGLYSMYGYNWLDNRFLATATYRISEFLENNGYEAVPLLNLPPQMGPLGIAVADGRPAPNVLLDFDDAAVRAGLGEIDPAGFFITPEFGTRQRFQIILTEAVLEPDPVPDALICDFIEEYSRFCPLQAINTEHIQEVEICGKKMNIAEIDFSKCSNCKNGTVPNMYHPSGKPDRIAAACGRAVYNELEKRDKLLKRFRNPFRKRPSWNIADNRVYLEEGSEIE